MILLMAIVLWNEGNSHNSSNDWGDDIDSSSNNDYYYYWPYYDIDIDSNLGNDMIPLIIVCLVTIIIDDMCGLDSNSIIDDQENNDYSWYYSWLLCDSLCNEKWAEALWRWW